MFRFNDSRSPFPWNNSAQRRRGGVTHAFLREFGMESSSDSDTNENGDSNGFSNTNSPGSSSSFNSSNGNPVQATLSLDNSDAVRNLSLDIEIVEAGGAASTPRVVSARRNRRANRISQHEDLVDLSHFDFDLDARIRAARFIAPEAVIDLCTPPRLPPYIDLLESADQLHNADVRARRRMAAMAGPSPRNRSIDLLNITAEDLYKCPVCLELVRTREPCTTRCGHIFCKTCIESAVRTTRKCPLCNKRTTLRQIIRIYL